MPRIDLNIVDRGIQGSKWVAEDTGLTAAHLDEVMEQKTDNVGALNSLPTPFARFFVAKEAFRRIMEEHLNPKKEAGNAYRQLVSDILDVFELLFNQKYHVNNSWKNGERIELIEWKQEECLATLKRQMPVLYNAIYDYYKTDIREEKLHFLVYVEEGKEKLLACTSPFTGFVTPPDMDKVTVRQQGVTKQVFVGKQYDGLHIRRRSGKEYFRDVVLFEERDKDFKNYLYNELFGSDEVDSRFKEIKEYVRSFKNDPDIRKDYRLKTTPMETEQNEPLVINGLSILSSDEIDVNSYFTSSLIRLPYRISRDHFQTVTYQNDSKTRDYDYLLPFKPEVLSLFEGCPIDSDLHINRNSVTVYLRYNGQTYQKEYAEEPLRPGMGSIVNMDAAKYNFEIGLFPNILSPKPQENDYFKLFVVSADLNGDVSNFTIDQISLAFYKKEGGDLLPIRELDPISTGAQFGVRPAVVRTRQRKVEGEEGTKLYELFHTAFDVIEVRVLNHTGLLLPKWEYGQTTNDTFTYAIDLGTSNTFISRCKNGENYKPELFKLSRPMVSFLHEIPDDRQFSLAKRIEESLFGQARSRVRTEFLPAIIDGTDYKFPIRTALCGVNHVVDEPRLFDNRNIAFFYEKLRAEEDQVVFTDIKWNRNDELLRLFVRELLLIIKCDILQRNADLDRTRLVWFSPLSFMGSIINTYRTIWNEEAEQVLHLMPGQITHFSESEAPYYYFKKMNYIKDSDAVTVIDIGGGSTDFVYFKDNKPLMANSVRFGCDVLWENGFIEFENERENGIYKRYVDTLRFKQRPDLEDLNESMKQTDSVKTKDIINFWLGNADFCDIKKALGRDFKPVFIYHLTAILFYMASMYRDKGYPAPRTVVFSGNGSKYIDDFICSDGRVLQQLMDLVFSSVFGGEQHVNLELPKERKESTCYGGLYRDLNAPHVKVEVYQGDAKCYEKVGDLSREFPALKEHLLDKYAALGDLYKEVLDLLKKEYILDNTVDTSAYVAAVKKDMGVPLNTYFKTQVTQKYQEDVEMTDSVFFLPIINRIFEMTKL